MPLAIAILHYASPPTVGGVESTIAHHARGLHALGHRVRIISGSGASFHPEIETRIEPLFGSRYPDVLAVKAELDAGNASSAFTVLVERQYQALKVLLADADIVIAHNIHTLNKNLALTAALAQLERPPCLAVCHDLAWTNEQYQGELHRGYPWELLRQAWPGTHYATVSEPRRAELAALLGMSTEDIGCLPPGVDLSAFFRWTPTTERIIARWGLLDCAGVLLLPARLTRRKNIAFALHVLSALRVITDEDYRLLVTGPPGPHNPGNTGYLGELLALRQSLHLQEAAHFVYELEAPPLIPDDDTMADLYQLADALLFPSTQEGFGIPLLEAGLARLPIYCADLPPLRQTGQADVRYFNPQTTDPSAVARLIAHDLAQHGALRLFRRVRQHYRWATIIQTRLMPLVEAML